METINEMQKVEDSAKQVKIRNSSLELLRIISMIFIVMSHYSSHGDFVLPALSVSFNKVFIQFLPVFGNLGVAVFVLISGYFLIESKFSFKKLLKLILEVLFYSSVIAIVFFAFNLGPITLSGLLKAFFPTIFVQYWFASVYVILYILSPFINMFLKVVKKETHFTLMLILLFISCIIPTFTTSNFNSSDLLWFITLYFVAAYFRLYPNKISTSLKINLLLTFIFAFAALLSVVSLDILGLNYSVFSDHATYFLSRTSFLTFGWAASLFLVFRNIKMRYHPFINYVSLSMFGIYLIHDNMYLRNIIWINLFHNSSYFDNQYLFVHAAVCISIVFVGSLLIDQARIFIFEKPLFALLNIKWDKWGNAIQLRYNAFMAKMSGKLVK